MAKLRITLLPLKASSAIIETPATKLTYNVGEVFDPAGMVIKVTHMNGDIESFSEFEYDSSSFKPFVIADTKQIIVVNVDGNVIMLDQAITVQE